MARIPIIGETKPTPVPAEHPNRIVVIFPDDHSIEGMKIEAVGITAEQIFIAVMHMQRIAMMTLAQRDRIVQQAEQEAMAVREQLARERN